MSKTSSTNNGDLFPFVGVGQVADIKYQCMYYFSGKFKIPNNPNVSACDDSDEERYASNEALVECAIIGSVDEAEYYINHLDADPNTFLEDWGGNFYHTCLTGACDIVDCHDSNIEMVQLLLAQPNILVNLPNNDTGRTALHYACNMGHVEIVSRLLKHPDTNPNKEDFEGKRPVEICPDGEPDAIDFLKKWKRKHTSRFFHRWHTYKRLQKRKHLRKVMTPTNVDVTKYAENFL